MRKFKLAVHFLFLFIICFSLSSVKTLNVNAAPVTQLTSAIQVTASEDAYIYQSFPDDTHDGVALTLEKQETNDVRVALIKFTSINMTDPITQVRLNMYGTACGGFLPFDANRRVDIYAVTNDAWSENTVTWNNFNAPPDTNRGTLLMSVDGGVANVEAYNYWTDIANGNFAQFVQSQNISNGGDGIVSLWLEIGTSGDASVTFMDTEDAGGFCGAAGDHPPILQYADSEGPLAITLSSLTATSNSPANLLGLVILGGCVMIISLFIIRRRKHKYM
jgi:hypothetical protein